MKDRLWKKQNNRKLNDKRLLREKLRWLQLHEPQLSIKISLLLKRLQRKRLSDNKRSKDARRREKQLNRLLLNKLGESLNSRHGRLS